MGLNPEGASTINTPEGAAKATVAAGCFWGVEHMFRKEFKGKGLYDARVGYIGGDTQSPSYRAVCSGRTGRTYSQFPTHPQPFSGSIDQLIDGLMLTVRATDAEALQVTYDPQQITYRQLLEF